MLHILASILLYFFLAGAVIRFLYSFLEVGIISIISLIFKSTKTAYIMSDIVAVPIGIVWGFIGAYITLLAIQLFNNYDWTKWIFIIVGFFFSCYNPKMESLYHPPFKLTGTIIGYITHCSYVIYVFIPSVLYNLAHR